ncbi:hypothetical protein [Piscinibacter sp. XHJ-5]|uniref:hypothetical protein n=1 Tax=Piscinibacter sp. XHJ-5 TaxID=3037797 RepID=UPI002452F442|nr:hypothetical protein [Piscinibacter sp. XHJ-5]
MSVFRWIIGVIGGLLATGAVLAFVIFIVTDIDVWIKRARAWRRLAWAIALFWFNVEIWRRVAIVIINWV